VACSSIHELDVLVEKGPLASTDWVAGLTGLRVLNLTAMNASGSARLRLPASISRLQHLAAAHLDGEPLDWGAVEHLPPTLTFLHLGGDDSEQMPTHVRD